MRHLIFIAALAASFITSSVTADTPKPNIVFIYADDWGWGDLSNDQGEQNELSESHPEIVARMKAQMNSWIDTLPTSSDLTCISKTVSTPKSSVKKNQ